MAVKDSGARKGKSSVDGKKSTRSTATPVANGNGHGKDDKDGNGAGAHPAQPAATRAPRIAVAGGDGSALNGVGLDRRELFDALTALRKGGFSVRLALDFTGGRKR